MTRPHGSRLDGSRLRTFWRRIRGPLWRERRLYLSAGCFEVLTLGTAILYPQLIRVVVDDGIENGSLERIHGLVLLMAGVLAVQAVATYLRTYLFEVASQRVTAAIREKLFGNLLVQELAFFDTRTSGDLASRLNADASQLGLLLRQLVPELVHFSLMGTVAGALMFHTSPLLAAVVCVVGPLLWVGTSHLGRLMRRQSRQLQDEFARLVDGSVETLSGIQTVKSFHAEESELARYRERTLGWLTGARRQARAASLLQSVNNLLSEAAVLLAIGVGGVLIVGGSLTAGALVTFILYAAMVMRSLKNVSDAAAEALRAQGATEHMFELAERRTRMAVRGGIAPASCRGDLAVEDVHFAYPTRGGEAALRGVSLEIPRGEVLALVGSSGSGKSTLARLLARLYDPDRGRVLLDGRDLRDYDPGWLRRQVLLVPADAKLFARTLDENLRYGRPRASAEEVETAARQAHAAGFIEALPQGYDSAAGEDGRLFSSGQRQRVAIARAILVEPRVVILDEATAALDSESETIVKEALRKLPQHPTLVIVSHRLSTIADADRVVLVREGRIAAVGTHRELLQAPAGDYRELVESQLLGE